MDAFIAHWHVIMSLIKILCEVIFLFVSIISAGQEKFQEATWWLLMSIALQIDRINP